VAVGFVAASQPSIYRVSSFWTSSPTWFAIRLGILMMALSGLFVVERVAGGQGARPLAVMGRNSLFVYWIHVELVYGYSSWLWRQRLPLWGTAIAYVLFCVLIYCAIGWRDRIVSSWRARGGFGRTAHVSPA
jgi:hypothetical protein